VNACDFNRPKIHIYVTRFKVKMLIFSLSFLFFEHLDDAICS